MSSLLLAIIYLSFISLGLPDALLGSAWPTIHPEFGVPVSYMGIISLIISSGTVVSSLMADRLSRRFGTGRITAFSVAITAGALLGFCVSRDYWMLLLWAVPYGLGAGSVDAALNNYVAIHYESRHMSWLHCMWGIGATIGPFIMSYALTEGRGWNMGYLYVGLIQTVLAAALVFSLPLWKKNAGEAAEVRSKPLSLRDTIAIPGAKEIMVAFFCYCALEGTAGQWASSYFVIRCGLAAGDAAGLASLFYIGITAGRAVSGFVTMKLNDTQMIRLGQGIIAVGGVLMLLPLGQFSSICGLLLIGLGCAPIYPCIIHSTPAHFGVEHSQALIGVQMASAYVGNCLMPPLFGVLAQFWGIGLLPMYLLVILAMMGLMYGRLVCICGE